MIKILDTLFSSTAGKSILTRAEEAIKAHNMRPRLEEGVVLGLSGGADSVMLLLVLLEIKRKKFDFPLVCVHINHMIRGNEADNDESFSKELCSSLGCEFYSYKVDIPALAKKEHKGIEEVARKVRYEKFNEVIKSRNDVSTITVAHNATDNLETVIFNMMRGAGISGLSGIKPVRDNIVRPLIYSSKKDILCALDSCGIRYVTDSTNLSTNYTRNYIRSTVIPSLERLTPSPEEMGTRVSKNLLEDIEALDGICSEFLDNNLIDDRVSIKLLRQLNKSIFYRVLTNISGQKSSILPERTHADAIYALLFGGNFSYSLPGGVRFVSKSGYAYIEDDIRTAPAEETFDIPLNVGVNSIPGYSTVIILSNINSFESYSNIYKIAIQAALPSDIIKDGLCVRTKIDGDAYAYGGITRKLKKLFNDRDIPECERAHVPVIYDKHGIVWVAGFGVRGEEEKVHNSFIALAEPRQKSDLKKLYVISRQGGKTI